jgi:hypothetical protein
MHWCVRTPASGAEQEHTDDEHDIHAVTPVRHEDKVRWPRTMPRGLPAAMSQVPVQRAAICPFGNTCAKSWARQTRAETPSSHKAEPPAMPARFTARVVSGFPSGIGSILVDSYSSHHEVHEDTARGRWAAIDAQAPYE